MSTEPAELFDDIATWRAQAALDLGLSGVELVAALSPGPAFPTTLGAIAGHVPPTPGTTIVDLGAGMCGASAWLAAATGATVIAVEPADGSRRAAQLLFPGLDVRAGSASASGLPDASADVVAALAVVSLLDELDGLFAEADRLLRPDGFLGVVDMFLADGDEAHDGPNTLRSIERTIDLAEAAGFAATSIGCADDAGPAAEWAAVAERVRTVLVAGHDGAEALGPWLADQRKLAEWISSGYVCAGCLVLRPLARPTRRARRTW
jgi:SAM-dependent methyltransferase